MVEEFSTAPRGLPGLASALRLLRQLSASPCLACAGKAGQQALCDRCIQSLPLASAGCPICALPGPTADPCASCLARPPSFDRTLALYRYTAPIDRLLRGLKFGGRLAFAGWAAEAFARQASIQAHADNAPRGAHPAPVLIPVALSAARLRERGYNQAHEIARRLPCLDGVLRGARLQAGALVRVRSTRAQARLDADERRSNLQDAFRADARQVGGRPVIVIDDVMTTGATLEAVAQALKTAGAVSVDNWVVARAVRQTA